MLKETEISDTPNEESLKEEVLEAVKAAGAIEDDKLIKLANAVATSHLRRFNKPSHQPEQPAVNPEVAKLQKQMQKLQDELAAKDEAAKKQAKAIREKDAYSSLSNQLKGKVRPEAEEVVAKLLFHADKRVLVKEDGTSVYVMDDGTEGSLEDGIASYLASPTAALFIPAPVSTATKTSSVAIKSSGANKPMVGKGKPSIANVNEKLNKLGLKL